MKTIIEMAHDAGFDITYDPTETPARCFVEAWEDQLEVFAALVAAAELERIIKVIESMGTWAHINEVIDEVRRQA